MAKDLVYEVKSGFYNSVNHDRLYTAADMNMPYKRLVTEGIYPVTDPTTDGFAISASGMDLTITVGGGLFAGRWVENEDAVVITVPSNASAYGRIDSVIIAVNDITRTGNIVYRQGTASSSPVHPAINQNPNVYEWRLYDVAVAAGAVSITSANITDLRTWAQIKLSPANVGFNNAFDDKSGSGLVSSMIVACGNVCHAYMTFSYTSGLVLEFPAGYEPSSQYVYGFNILGSNGLYGRVSQNGNDEWEIVVDDGWIEYLNFTYIKD